MRRCNCRCNSRYMNYNSNNNCRCRNCNTNNSNNCGCNMYANETSQNNSIFPENYLYGYSYTPNSCMGRTFTPEVGLENGTIFPELVSPYSPGQSIDFIEFLRNGGV